MARQRRRSRPWAESIERRLLLATFPVSHTGDSGSGSLRQAILDSNATPGADSIVFGIPASSSPLLDTPVPGFDPETQTWTIIPLSPLPAIADGTTLDGYSQAHAPVPFRYPSTIAQILAMTGGPTGGSFTLTTSAPLPIITTDPIPWDANAAQVLAALTNKLGTGNVFVTGGPAFPDTTITVSFIGDYADLSVPALIANNNLIGGINPTITASKIANGDPKFIVSTPNTIEAKNGNDSHIRVIIDGSLSGGTGITVAAPHVNVRGLAIGNFEIGVQLNANAQGARVQGNAIGGVIVYPVDPATGDPLDAPANEAFLPLGNLLQGIRIAATNAFIGGVAPAENNVISLNGTQGIWILPGAQGNQVFGNQIGVAGPSTIGRYYQVSNGAQGILVESSSNAIGGAGGAGNIISANLGHGVHILGTDAVRNRVENNFIGAPPGGDYVFGTGDPGNRGDGVLVENAPDNRVGGASGDLRNVIVGNGISSDLPFLGGAGVRISGPNASRNTVEGNFIGVTAGGISVLGNALDGVYIDSPNNTVGAGNVIAGNLRGVLLAGASATSNLILDNLIGTDSDGQADLGNTHEGIRIESSSNTVRGDAAGSQVISGNDQGVVVVGASATRNLIVGNFIGTNISGTQDVANSNQGVYLLNAPLNTIGGTIAGTRNVISANHWGIVISGSGATGNSVFGNFIGTEATGTERLSNEVDGVLINDGAANNSIGATNPDAGNVIAFNQGNGVFVASPTSVGNAILSNRIFDNAGLGTDLVPGANRDQSAPALDSARTFASRTTITGTLSSTPNSTFLLQFYSNDIADPSGAGEGQRLLGSELVTTNAAGNAAVNVTFIVVLIEGTFVSATATNLLTRDTSEFSINQVVIDFSTTVINTNDSGPGSLRQAILNANAIVGQENLIDFQIPGTDLNFDFDTETWKINLSSPLPAITDPVVINGYTQQATVNAGGLAFVVTSSANTLAVGDNARLRIIINGAQTNGDGLVFSNTRGTVRGLIIDEFNVGIKLFGPGASDSRIEGNFIGAHVIYITDKVVRSTIPVLAGIGNRVSGIEIDGATDVTIGAATPAARNVVIGNGINGILLGAGSNRASIEGNYVGITAPGAAPVYPRGNGGPGIRIQSAQNTIGGSTDAARNVISGNSGAGIFIDSGANSNQILGNFIGTDLNGVFSLTLDRRTGNALGIHISNAANNLIGGTLPGVGNRIAFSSADGVRVEGVSLGNSILTNEIFQNATIGIDLVDPGSNNQQSAPTLTTIVATSNNTNIAGTLQSAPNTAYTIQLFSNNDLDPSGNAEGETALGQTRATTDASGFVAFSAIVSTPIQPGQIVTATATDPAGNTSEFSLGVTLSAPMIAFSAPTYGVVESSTQATITVNRTGDTARSVAVEYATSNGTAQAGIDYTDTRGVLTFGPGVTSRNIVIPILFNPLSTAPLTVLISLSNPAGGATLVTPSTAVLTITNVVAPQVVSISAAPARRGSNQIVITYDQQLFQNRAENLLNYGYSLRTAGRDHKIGTRDDVLVGLRRATYNDATQTVTLTTNKFIPGGRKILVTINATTDDPSANIGVANLSGTLLDGNGDGRPGGVLRTVIVARQTPKAQSQPQGFAPRRRRAVVRRPSPTHAESRH